MSFFHPEIPLKEKVVSHHPWEKYIKDAYASTYKYGHNSAKNPIYPPKKEKETNPNRMKFTVIGNRISKEFIYSMNLVKGLHKYRWRQFDAPVIRGVTSVEWPKVWNDLKMQYGGMAYCLQSQVAILMNDKFLGGEKELKAVIEAKYVYHICPDHYKEAVKIFSNYIKSSGRPCAYLQISVDNEPIGTMIFMLYSDVAPRTCENFLRLCKTNKGGYSGTPVHRIVKDCWIQCGGFGIKDTKMDCENFIIPHDRRGVLGMANDGRHTDCSTQFFVLLQPATWMANKYVAFGQLIDGENTLKKIEEIPAWYESPTQKVIIYKAGIFNMECQDISINKNTNEYIAGHVENLFTIGELFYEALLEKVFLEVNFRSVQRLQKEMAGEGADAEVTPEEAAKNLRTTQRFMRKKEEIDKQIEKSQVDRSGIGTPVVVDKENNDFDVEEYEYEPEEYSYKHVSISGSTSLYVKPDKPFYIPITDVPYPGEVDSTFDLKRLLQGDYCLEADLEKDLIKKKKDVEGRFSFPSEIFDILFQTTPSTESESQESLDSEDEKEIKIYLQRNVDRVSIAGEVIKAVAKTGKFNIFESKRRSDLITDETLRRVKLATEEYKIHREKKVSISIPTEGDTHKEIKRRQTGFVRPEDLDRIRQFQSADSDEDDDDEDDDDNDNGYDDDDAEADAYNPYTRQVKIGELPAPVAEVKEKRVKPLRMSFAQTDDLEQVKSGKKANSSKKDKTKRHFAKNVATGDSARTGRRTSAFMRPMIFDDEHDVREEKPTGEEKRESVLSRLFEEVDEELLRDEDPPPTLKNYRPYLETLPEKNMFLTATAKMGLYGVMSVEDPKEKFKRHSLPIERRETYKSIDQVLTLQHGTHVYRKISSDYIRTIDHIENKAVNSIRSLEYAKTRPAISVREYQKRNREYEEHLAKSNEDGKGYSNKNDTHSNAHNLRKHIHRKEPRKTVGHGVMRSPKW